MSLPVEERKQIENEMFFRKANEKIGAGIDELNALCDEYGTPAFKWNDWMLMSIECECSDENCTVRIPIRWSVYQTIHENRDNFIIATGHQVTDIETVVDEQPTYSVVHKNNSTPMQKNPTLHDTDVDNT